MSKPKTMRNLGPKSTAWLEEVGIRSLEDLRRMGSVAVYAMVRSRHADATLNLLWALEAALQDIDWRELPPEEKSRLRLQLAELTS